MTTQVQNLLSVMGDVVLYESINVTPTVTLVCKIKPVENKFILPVVFGRDAEAYTRQKLYENRVETELTLVRGLKHSGDAMRRTFPTIIRDFVGTPSYNLLKISTNKGNIYYGNRNIILDEYFHPLFIPAMEYSIDGEFSSHTFLIDPAVFTRTDIISNNLKKDVVAYFGTRDKVLVAPLSNYLISSLGPATPEEINELVQRESALIAESLKPW